ncbi:hypothetical protein [Archangium gephyra]|uniref:Bacterial Ig-like domain-containing protein n=1 Tax=Archangium gephyra TaxID=48 RepID=A0AAC8Q982_9BACT|nr:hypothetical protein [Archangium gephyra]AKJ03244.1 Hypothetical protein AA314_04870 [Archangium gephyra]
MRAGAEGPRRAADWSTLLVAKGKHTLTARATDTLGNVATSAAVSVTVQ